MFYLEGYQLLLTIMAAIAVGSLAGYFGRQSLARREADSVETKVLKIIEEAKDKAKEILLAAKNKAVEILEDAKKEEQEHLRILSRSEERLEKKEVSLEQKIQELAGDKKVLEQKVNEVKSLKTEIEGIKNEQFLKLQKVAGFSVDEAKQQLFQRIEEESKAELVEKMRKFEELNKEELDKKARDIVILSIQKIAVSQAVETTTSIVNLPSDELKGRIIGREGRNIKAIEQLCGVEIIVDDTPEAIIVSGFDPVRRQIAKTMLDKLISDGRIHPGRIEEAFEESRRDIAIKIKELGETAVYEVGLTALNPKIVQLMGRLRFRTSYGQNVLLHSIEVAHLAAGIAGEIGADIALAKKAGFLHDIGKALDHEIEGSHVDIGVNILKKFNVSEDVIAAMKSHHEDYPYESIEAIIVGVADAISASRPGARKDTLENYIKRLTELEAIANSFEGIEKSFAISAGREIRIFVKPDKIDDLGSIKLSKQIAEKIEEQLDYPGEIKVHVIRETRAVDYAR